MANIYIGKEELEKLEIYNPDVQHSESILYLDKERRLLYKFLTTAYPEDREHIIEFLKSYRNEFCSLPIDTLIDRNNMSFAGYTQEFYKGYVPGSLFIARDNSFHTMQELAYLICTIFDRFRHDDIAYLDIHIDNILIDPKDTKRLKIIDMDSIFLKWDLGSEEDYEKEIMEVQRLASKIALAFVLGEDLQELLTYDENMGDCLTEALKPLCRSRALEDILYFTFHDANKIITPCELIESLRGRDVAKAKDNIYRLKKQMNI